MATREGLEWALRKRAASRSGCGHCAGKRTSLRATLVSLWICTSPTSAATSGGSLAPRPTPSSAWPTPLGVSGDYLLEGATDEAAKARFEDRELLRRFQEVQELPDRDKEIVKELLDAFLTRRQVQQLAAR